MEPVRRSPLFTASGSGRRSRACLGGERQRVKRRDESIGHVVGKGGAYCQCVRGTATHVNVLNTNQKTKKKATSDSPLGPVERVTVSPSAGGGGVGPGFNGCSCCVIHCHALPDKDEDGTTGKSQLTSSSLGAGLGWKSRSNHEAKPCTREVRETIKSMGMVNSRRSALEQV